jgi:radical SAM protein with 4Fe4S-binding SPASM domain
MDCPTPTLSSNVDFMNAFNARIVAERIPYSGSFELTRRCNLKCVHCYCGDRAIATAPNRWPDEVSTDAACDYLSQTADAGCLFMLLTGGEPLLRPDFAAIYRHAKSCGFLISLFTNGTVVTDSLVELFRELPPHGIEISVYGASPGTYERVTGHAGAYRRCREGIDRLLDAGVNVKLKTILMQGNRSEFSEIEALARSLGLQFRFDSGITGRMDGDVTPLDVRVPAKEIAALEFSDSDRIQGWKEWVERKNGTPRPERLYNCGAGVTAFHIDASGWLRPCPSNETLGWDMAQDGFLAAWRKMSEAIAGLRAPDGLECNRCPDRDLCTWCPAFAQLEGQSEVGPVRFLCEVAAARRKQLEAAG